MHTHDRRAPWESTGGGLRAAGESARSRASFRSATRRNRPNALPACRRPRLRCICGSQSRPFPETLRGHATLLRDAVGDNLPATSCVSSPSHPSRVSAGWRRIVVLGDGTAVGTGSSGPFSSRWCAASQGALGGASRSSRGRPGTWATTTCSRSCIRARSIRDAIAPRRTKPVPRASGERTETRLTSPRGRADATEIDCPVPRRVCLGEDGVDCRGQENARHWYVAEIDAQSSLTAPDHREKRQDRGGDGAHEPRDKTNHKKQSPGPPHALRRGERDRRQGYEPANATRNCRYHSPPSQAGHRCNAEAVPLSDGDVVRGHRNHLPSASTVAPNDQLRIGDSPQACCEATQPAIIEQVFLAGPQVPDARVLQLARRLSAAGFHDLADRLEAAWRREVNVLALEVADRERDPARARGRARGVHELRGVLLAEHVWRQREGLGQRTRSPSSVRPGLVSDLGDSVVVVSMRPGAAFKSAK